MSRPLRLSLRNTFRRRGRLVRTLIPLMLGGAIFMTVLSVHASLFRTLEETLVSQGFDVQLQLSRAHRQRTDHSASSRDPRHRLFGELDSGVKGYRFVATAATGTAP